MMNSDLIKFYYKILFPYRWRVISLFIFPIIWCVAETIAPYLIKVIIDNFANVPNINKVIFLELLGMPILYYLILIIIIEIAIRGCNYIWLSFIPELRADFRNAILSRVLSQPISFYQNHLIGEIVTKFKNLSNSFELIFSSFLYGIFPVFISSLIILSFLFYIDHLFAICFMLWFVCMNIITLYFANKNIDFSNKCAFHENILLGHFGDLFRNIMSIKIFDGKASDHKITRKFQTLEIERAKKLEWLTFKIDSLRSVVSIMVFLAITTLLGWGYIIGRLTLGDFSFITATCFYIRRSVWIASVNLLNLFKEIGVAKEAFNDLIHSDIKVKSSSKVKLDRASNHDIKFKSVCFGYDKDHILFNELTLHIPESQNVIINGKSGSGKTTLMQLMLSFFPIKYGEILIGNTNIKNLSTKNDIVYVPQRSELFHRGIKDNIIYGNPNVGQKELKRVLRLTEIDEFISNLDNEEETLVGENGAKLSNGQSQRVAIARALLNKPVILILDEATSALDSLMEKNILKNIIEYTDVRILILVSHNNKNLKLFDRVLSFENGIIKDDYLIKK